MEIQEIRVVVNRKKGKIMKRREFLEKFVALSSVSLILAGCVGKQEQVIDNNKNVKFRDIISDSNGNRPMPIYGSPSITPRNNGFKPIIQKR